MMEVTNSLGCFATIFAIFSSVSRGYTDPVGFDGVHKMINLDFSFKKASRASGFSKKSSDSSVEMIIGVASARRAISG